MPTQTLKVTTDVRRDLLASAAMFKNEAAVVWEYVVNSLQYVDRGIAPRVQVTVKPRQREIEVGDNGRGMNAEELQHYFRMHGENIDRLRGRMGRGKFGTGKSAAFGIGNAFTVDTRKSGLRNVVALTREMIDRSKGDEISLDWMVRNEATDLANGTTVTVSDIVIPRVSAPSIIDYIERHLQAFRATGAEVAVNDHICEYREPAIAETFDFRPTPAQAQVIGDIKLTVKVGQVPLPDSEQGIAITAGAGNLVAIERAAIDRKEFGNYLFGDVDVPNLELAETPIAAYDSSRSLSLNPSHPVCLLLIPFIGSKLEEVRQKLVHKEREARKNDQARRLAKEAERIADILNKDFETVRQRLSDIRAASSSRGPAQSAFGSQSEAGSVDGNWVEGFQAPGDIHKSPNGNKGEGGRNRVPPTIVSSGSPNPSGKASVDPAGGDDSKRRKPQGGLRVLYRNLGPDEARSVYDPTSFSILINLDHAVVSAALGDGSVEEPVFRRLSYEIAFSEYAMMLGYEMAQRDPEIPADDLLYEVRSSLNRVSLGAADLYR